MLIGKVNLTRLNTADNAIKTPLTVKRLILYLFIFIILSNNKDRPENGRSKQYERSNVVPTSALSESGFRVYTEHGKSQPT